MSKKEGTAIAPTGAGSPYEAHPIADVIPAFMNDEEFRSLKDSISKRGLRIPITVYEGKLLDGRARYLACVQLNKMPDFNTFEGTQEEAREYVLDLNVRRKHLKPMQKAIVAARLALKQHVSVRDAAGMVGIGHFSVTIAAQLLTTNNIAAIKKCERGELSRADAEEATAEVRRKHGNVIPIFGSGGNPGGTGTIVGGRSIVGHNAVETTPSKLAAAFKRMKLKDRKAFVELAWALLEPVLGGRRPWTKAKHKSAVKEQLEGATKALDLYFGKPRPASVKEQEQQKKFLLARPKGPKGNRIEKTVKRVKGAKARKAVTKGKARRSK